MSNNKTTTSTTTTTTTSTTLKIGCFEVEVGSGWSAAPEKKGRIPNAPRKGWSAERRAAHKAARATAPVEALMRLSESEYGAKRLNRREAEEAVARLDALRKRIAHRTKSERDALIAAEMRAILYPDFDNSPRSEAYEVRPVVTGFCRYCGCAEHDGLKCPCRHYLPINV